MSFRTITCPHCQGQIPAGKVSRHDLHLIIQTLGENGWNRSIAAELLGMSRKALSYWVTRAKACGIDVPDSDPESRRRPMYMRGKPTKDKQIEILVQRVRELEEREKRREK